jgi:putative ABC transport system permease protein
MLSDVRYALRRLRAAPGFAAVVLLTVALGVGANTAIFSVVNAMLLRALPYRDAGRLVAVWQDHRAVGRDQPEWQTPPDLFDIQKANRTLDGVVALQGWGATLTTEAEPQRVPGAAVSHDYFALLGIPLAQGRGFTAEEDTPDAPRVVIITHRFWNARLGGRPGVVGTTLRLNDAPWTIVGVLPNDFRDPLQNAGVYRPLRLAADGPCGRGCYTLRAIGRLKPGVSVEQARADVAGIMRRLGEQFPETNKNVGAWLVPLRAQLVGDVKPALLALLGAVGFVLLIACVNVANLLLARATGRSREVAVRTALGAGRDRLVRQLLTESLVLAALGGALGLLLGAWGTRLVAARLPNDMADYYRVVMDGRVVVFTVALSALAALVFGLGPALLMARTGVAGVLRAGGRGASAGRTARRVRDVLVVGEVALALVLLTGAGLMMRSFVARQRVEPGFRPENLLIAGVTLPARYLPNNPETAAFYDQLLARLRRDPRVRAVGTSSETPLQGGDGDLSFQVEGRPATRPPAAWVRFVSTDYLRTMGIKVVAGRGLTDADARGTPTVAVVSETFAKRHWPGESAVGKRIIIDGFVRADSVTGPITVVGVANDVRFDALDAPGKVELYLSTLQVPRRATNLVVRADADAAALTALVRREVAALDRAVPLGFAETMEERMRNALAMPKLYASLFAVFAGAALALAAIGIYGVVAFAVERRTRELGVRLALGARAEDVRRLVVAQGMGPVVAGVVVGLGGALAAARALRSLLFGVGANDPATFAATTLFLVGVALMAAWLPARRATRVAPTEALRAE